MGLLSIGCGPYRHGATLDRPSASNDPMSAALVHPADRATKLSTKVPTAVPRRSTADSGSGRWGSRAASDSRRLQWAVGGSSISGSSDGSVANALLHRPMTVALLNQERALVLRVDQEQVHGLTVQSFVVYIRRSNSGNLVWAWRYGR